MRNELGRLITGNITETGQYYNETGLSAVMYASYLLAASGGAVAGGTAMLTLSPANDRLLTKTATAQSFSRATTTQSFTRTEV